MKVVCAIPCFNCETQISRVLEDLVPILQETPEIIGLEIIDNGSIDHTRDAVLNKIRTLNFKEVRPRLWLNEKNYGLGGSHKVAWRLAVAAGASHLAIIHGDHQAKPAELKNLIRVSQSRHQTTVVGARFTRKMCCFTWTELRGSCLVSSLFITHRFI